MQKVEGSSPFSRLDESAAKAGLLFFEGCGSAQPLAKNARISSRAAIVGSPASSIRCAVTTLCGLATTCLKNGGRSGFAALSGSTRATKRSPSASA